MAGITGARRIRIAGSPRTGTGSNTAATSSIRVTIAADTTTVGMAMSGTIMATHPMVVRTTAITQADTVLRTVAMAAGTTTAVGTPRPIMVGPDTLPHTMVVDMPLPIMAVAGMRLRIMVAADTATEADTAGRHMAVADMVAVGMAGVAGTGRNAITAEA